jgi:hypothetical protein
MCINTARISMDRLYVRLLNTSAVYYGSVLYTYPILNPLWYIACNVE